MISDALFTSRSDEWETPPELYRALDDEFHFTVDLCASDENHLCERYYTKDRSGMDADLSGERVFCNPPYGKRSTREWMKKCYECGADVVVMLIPARTDTKAFHEYVYRKAEIRFLQGRLTYGMGGVFKNRSPFPSMIVVFRKEDTK